MPFDAEGRPPPSGRLRGAWPGKQRRLSNVGIAQAAGRQAAMTRIRGWSSSPSAEPINCVIARVEGPGTVWTEVWTNLWTVGPHQDQPPPPLYLGLGGGPEPDYPPATMCVAGSLARVLVFGCAAGAGAGEQGSWGRRVGWFQRFGWGSKSTSKSTATAGETMRAGGAGVIVAALGLWGGR